MQPNACKTTGFWQCGRRSRFVTFLALIPKLAIRVRRDKDNGRNENSPSSMPRHASKSNWTRMHVSESRWENCHCDHCLRFVSLLWVTLESESEQSRNIIYDYTTKIQWPCVLLGARQCKHRRPHDMNISLLKRRACIANAWVRCGSSVFCCGLGIIKSAVLFSIEQSSE